MTAMLLKIWKLLHLPKSWQLWFMRRFQDEFLVGVTGVIFNDHNKVLVLKHSYRTKPWSLPGGYIKAKEHPKEAIEREIMEETGMVVSADIRYKIRTDRETARLDIVYIGTYVGGEFEPSAEVVEAKFFAFEDLPDIRRSDLLLIEKTLRLRREGRLQSFSRAFR